MMMMMMMRRRRTRTRRRRRRRKKKKRRSWRNRIIRKRELEGRGGGDERDRKETYTRVPSLCSQKPRCHRLPSQLSNAGSMVAAAEREGDEGEDLVEMTVTKKMSMIFI